MSWQNCALGDVLTLKRGYDLPANVRAAGDVPVVSSSGMTGYHNEAKAAAPGVVTGRYGTIGEVYFIDEPYWPLNTALYVVDFKGTDPRFAAYLLRNTLRNYQSEKAAVPGVDRNVLHTLKVRTPGAKEQAAIVDILSAYDDLIENNRRRIALLEESARLLYREWFVHFRFPGHEHVEITDGLPEGWERRRLCDVAENFDRMRVPLSVMEREKRRGSYPYYGAAGRIDCVDNYLFDGRYLLMGEDGTVVTERGSPMLQLVDGRFWVNNHAHVLKGTRVSTELLYFALSEYGIRGHITGVAQPKITQANMNRIPISVPTLVLKRDFQEVVDRIVDQRFTLERYNQKLTQARDLLLPRLMNGEIAV